MAETGLNGGEKGRRPALVGLPVGVDRVDRLRGFDVDGGEAGGEEEEKAEEEEQEADAATISEGRCGGRWGWLGRNEWRCTSRQLGHGAVDRDGLMTVVAEGRAEVSEPGG